jgi:hypothetical protein
MLIRHDNAVSLESWLPLRRIWPPLVNAALSCLQNHRLTSHSRKADTSTDVMQRVPEQALFTFADSLDLQHG